MTQPDPPGSRPLTILSGSQMYRRAFRAGHAYATWYINGSGSGPAPDTTNPFDASDESEQLNTPYLDTLGDALLVRSTSGRIAVAIYPGPEHTRATVKDELQHTIEALIDFHNGEVLNP